MSAPASSTIKYTTSLTGDLSCTGFGSTYTTQINLAQNRTVRAVYCLNGERSQYTTRYYAFATTTPISSHASGSYNDQLSLTLSAAGAPKIVYSVNDVSTLSCSTSTSYTTPITISDTSTVRAVACYPDNKQSNVLELNYILPSTNTDTPIINPAAGTYNGAIRITATSTSGYQIRYTTGETNPTCTTGTVLSNYYDLIASRKVNVLSCTLAGRASNIISNTYTLNKCSYAIRPRPTGPILKCFNNTSLASNPGNNFEVMQNIQPPVIVNDQNYPYHPITMAATLQRQPLFSTSGEVFDNVKKIFFLWANRCHNVASSNSGCTGFNLKGNVVFTVEKTHYRSFFDTRRKADVCTLAQAYGVLGVNYNNIPTLLTSNNLVLATNDSQLSQKSFEIDETHERLNFIGSQVLLDKYLRLTENATRPWIVNTCYIPELDVAYPYNNAGKLYGVLFDWEVQDKRTEAETSAFFDELHAGIRTYSNAKLMLYSNNWIDTGAINSGLGAISGKDAIENFDYVSIFAFPGNMCKYNLDPITKLLDDQKNKIFTNVPIADQSNLKRKLYVLFDMANDQNIGSSVRDYIINNNLAGVFLWRNYHTQTTCTPNSVSTNYVQHVMSIMGVNTSTSSQQIAQSAFLDPLTEENADLVEEVETLPSNSEQIVSYGSPSQQNVSTPSFLPALPLVGQLDFKNLIAYVNINLTGNKDILVQGNNVLPGKCEFSKNFLFRGVSYGIFSQHIADLQSFLIKYLNLKDNDLLVSGSFGIYTEKALKDFQVKNKLYPTGRLDLLTQDVIYKECRIL